MHDYNQVSVTCSPSSLGEGAREPLKPSAEPWHHTNGDGAHSQDAEVTAAGA